MTALVYAVPDTAETIDRDPPEALARGDEAAWRSTVRRFEGMVRSTARSVLRNDADVDEAVQRTWVLLPYGPDWRWMLNRTDSPWYPTAKLFRQPSPNNWAAAVQRVAQELEAVTGSAARRKAME